MQIMIIFQLKLFSEIKVAMIVVYAIFKIIYQNIVFENIFYN